jgi:hypothetical protein
MKGPYVATAEDTARVKDAESLFNFALYSCVHGHKKIEVADPEYTRLFELWASGADKYGQPRPAISNEFSIKNVTFCCPKPKGLLGLEIVYCTCTGHEMMRDPMGCKCGGAAREIAAKKDTEDFIAGFDQFKRNNP